MLRQFTKNLTTNWAVYLLAALLSFFLTPYIIARIGQAAFGVWVLVGSFSGYLGLFDFGIGFAVVRYVARYQKTGDVERRNEVVATAFYIGTLLAGLVLAATVVLMINADRWFDIPTELIGHSRMAILLVGLSIAIGFPLSIFSEALAGGLFRFDLFNTVSMLIALFRAGLTVLLIEADLGLVGLGMAALVGSLAGYLWRMAILFRHLPDLSLHPRLVSRAVLNRIGNYSLFSFLLVLSGRLAFYTDSFVVGFFRGVEDVAVFGIAAKLVEYLRQLVFTMSKLFTPVASRYDPEADQASLRRIFYDGSRLNILFSLPISLVLFFWGGNFIHLWVGGRFDSAAPILQVLLIGHVLSFMQGIGGDILLGVGRHRLLAILSLIAAVINLALSTILIKFVGLVGVAWGTTIPLALLSVCYLPIASLRLVGGRMGEFWREVLRPVLIVSTIPGSLVIILSGHVTTLPTLAAGLAVIAAVYLPSAYWLGLTPVEREKARSLWKPKG